MFFVLFFFGVGSLGAVYVCYFTTCISNDHLWQASSIQNGHQTVPFGVNIYKLFHFGVSILKTAYVYF